MPSQYLAQSDLNDYGVPNATKAQIIEASNLIDGYLKRPEGLQWMPDYLGLPCYMAALNPTLSVTVAGGIAAGTNVSVPVPASLSLSVTGLEGTVVVLDRASALQGKTGLVEACVITAVSPNSGTITLASVANTHASGVVMDFGLVISEQRTLPSKRSVFRPGAWPICRVHSLLGSYRYGRRDDQQAGLYQDASILAMMQTFGGPPQWFATDITAVYWNGDTNEVWVPSGVYMAYYSDVRIFYVAGFQQSAIPSIIKTVTARIITAGINTADLAGGVKMARAGDTAIQKFENSVLDDDTRIALAQYRARVMA